MLRRSGSVFAMLSCILWFQAQAGLTDTFIDVGGLTIGNEPQNVIIGSVTLDPIAAYMDSSSQVSGDVSTHHFSYLVKGDGTVLGNIHTYNASTAIVMGGQVGNSEAFDFSQIHMSGGLVNGNLISHNSSIIIVNDGVVSGKTQVLDDSIMSITNGSFNGATVSGAGLLILSGGYLGDLCAGDDGAVDIIGGIVGKLKATGNSSIQFTGISMSLTFPVSDGNGGWKQQLFGSTVDGYNYAGRWVYSAENGKYSVLNVPEGGILSMLSSVSLVSLLIARRRKRH